MGFAAVVVTGCGVVSPLGNDVETFWKSLCEGKSGVRPISRFDVSGLPVRIAAQAEEPDFGETVPRKELARLPRFARYALWAALKARESAGLGEGCGLDPKRAGAMIGSGLGGMEWFDDASNALRARGPGRVSPFFIPNAIANCASGAVSLRLGWRGPNWSAVSACATGNHNIVCAADQIRAGRADVMLAGASEEGVCPVALAGFSSMRALSTRNDEPGRASRPFDRDRDGFVLGEGAAVLVLEREDHARARGARILARLAGCGTGADAWHPTAPDPEGVGAEEAMRLALREAGIGPGEVGLVSAHGTSTPLGDLAEARAIRRLFRGERPRVNAAKSMLGHALAAGSALEAVACVLSLRDGILHPNPTLETPDPEIDLDLVGREAVREPVRFVLSNAFGFGGHNSSLLFARV